MVCTDTADLPTDQEWRLACPEGHRTLEFGSASAFCHSCKRAAPVVEDLRSGTRYRFPDADPGSGAGGHREYGRCPLCGEHVEFLAVHIGNDHGEDVVAAPHHAD